MVIEGVRGVFVPEFQFRQRTEWIEKGFNYYTQYKLTTLQLSMCDSTRKDQEKIIKLLNENLNRVEANLKIQGETLIECEEDRTNLEKAYLNEKKKNKFWPWITGAAFVVGGYIGSQVVK